MVDRGTSPPPRIIARSNKGAGKHINPNSNIVALASRNSSDVTTDNKKHNDLGSKSDKIPSAGTGVWNRINIRAQQQYHYPASTTMTMAAGGTGPPPQHTHFPTYSYHDSVAVSTYNSTHSQTMAWPSLHQVAPYHPPDSQYVAVTPSGMPSTYHYNMSQSHAGSSWNMNAQQYIPLMNVATPESRAPPTFASSFTSPGASQKLDPSSKPFDLNLGVQSESIASQTTKPGRSPPPSREDNEKQRTDDLPAKKVHDNQERIKSKNNFTNDEGDGFTKVVRKNKNEGKGGSKMKDGSKKQNYRGTKNLNLSKQGKGIVTGGGAASLSKQGAAVILRRPGGAGNSINQSSLSTEQLEQRQQQQTRQKQALKDSKKNESQSPSQLKNGERQQINSEQSSSATSASKDKQAEVSKKNEEQTNTNRTKNKSENNQKKNKSKQKYHDLNLSDLIVLPGEEASSKKSKKKKLQQQQKSLQHENKQVDPTNSSPKAISSAPLHVSPPPLLSDAFPSLSSTLSSQNNEVKVEQIPSSTRASQPAMSGLGQQTRVSSTEVRRKDSLQTPNTFPEQARSTIVLGKKTHTSGLGQASWATKQTAAVPASTQQSGKKEASSTETAKSKEAEQTNERLDINSSSKSGAHDNSKTCTMPVSSKKTKQHEKHGKRLHVVSGSQNKKANSTTKSGNTNNVLDPRVMQSFGESFSAFAAKGRVGGSSAKAGPGILSPMLSIKKGKQRIGPRTKRLTTLKKRVLQERLQKYKVAEALKKESLRDNTVSLKSDETPERAPSEQKEKAENASVASVSRLGSKTVCLINFMDADDNLDDDDEFEEISSEICGLTRGVGPVEGIYLPRSISDESNLENLSFVTFQHSSDAARACHCWNGMVLGGTALQAYLVVNLISTTTTSKDRLDDGKTGIAIAIYNALSDEDREDEECQEETLNDIKQKLKEYGNVGDVYVARINMTNGESSDDVIIAWFNESQLGVALKAIHVLNEMYLGGSKLYAELAFNVKNPNISVSSDNGDVDDTLDASEKSQQIATKQLETNLGHIVAMKGVLSQDDIDDEECLEETKEDVSSIVEKYGEVVEMVMCTSGRHKGNVFVVYENHEIASKAMKGLSSTVLGGVAFNAYLCSAISQGEEEEANDSTIDAQSDAVMDDEGGTLYLSNVLSEEDLEDEDCINECLDDLKEIVSKFGDVQDISLCTNNFSQHGQVQVTFEGGVDVAKAAKLQLNDVVIGGQKIVARFASDAAKPHGSSEVTSEPVDNALIDSRVVTTVVAKSEQESLDAPKDPVVTASGKVLSERWAECKRAPKIPNAQPSRSYAYTLQNPDTVPLLQDMLGKLMAFQIKSKDDSNARARRRMVMGFREAARGLRANKVKMVVLANNLDEYGAIDSKTEEILNMCREKEIPLFFEFNKRKLGKAIGKSIKIGIVAIQNADGAHEEFKKLKKILAKEAPTF